MLFLNPSHEDGVVMENPSAGLSHPRLMIGLPFFFFFFKCKRWANTLYSIK